MADSVKISYDSDDEYHSRLTLPYWVPTNRKNFSDFIQKQFVPEFQQQDPLTKHDFQGETVAQLHTPQQFVAEYLQDNSPYRGLLLYHGLGSGKSAASIAITEGMSERRVVIMLPASLRDNYLKEIEKFSTIHLSTDYTWVYKPIVGLTSRQQLVESGKSSTFHDFFQQLNSGLGLDKEIIPEMLTERRAKEKGKIDYGIWLIQPDPMEGAPHYDDLLPREQNEINKMMKTVFNYKYQFIHYNAGRSLIKTMFDGVGHTTKAEILQAVNRESSTQYDSWDRLEITKLNKNAVLNLVARGAIENPFNNKVIVVDEIHNMVSRIIGGGYTGKVIYPLLMKATNAKLIFLSGTPAINSPYELGILFNMLAGETTVHQFRLGDNSHPTRKQSSELLRTNSNIDFYSVGDDGRIKITQNYPFFTNVYGDGGDYLGVTRDESKYIVNQFPTTILSTFPKELSITQAPSESISHSMFPSFNVDADIPKQIDESKTAFQNLYVDLANNEPKRTDQFKSRIVGLVSFFNETTRTDETGHSVFPSKIETAPKRIPLSNYQFIKYSQARDQERELEVKSSKKGTTTANQQLMESSLDDNKSISYFKVISRNSQLFVFPPNLERLWPKDIRKRIEMEQSICETLNQVEVDAGETCAVGLGLSTELESLHQGSASSRTGDKRLANEQYLEVKDNILGGLTYENLNLRSHDHYNIRVLSPKYVDIFQKIEQSPGPVLCYSQFRTVEGIEVFTRVLDKNGYQPYQLGADLDYSIQKGSRIRYRISDDLWVTLEVMDLQGGRYGILPSELISNLRHIYQENGFSAVEATRKAQEVASQLLRDNSSPKLKRSQSDTVYNRPKRDLSRKYSTKWGGAEESKASETVDSKSGDVIPPDLPQVQSSFDVGEVEREELIYLSKTNDTGEQLIFNATYAVWSSGLGQDLLDMFNNPANKYGQEISVIFITMAGAEGISLYNVRQVHVMEPFWNKVKIDQVIGRARRIDSHANLPAGNEQGKNNQRKVHVYQYLGVFTEEQRTGKWGEGQDYQAVLGDQMEGLDPSKVADLDKIQQKFKAQISQYSSDIEAGDNGLTSDETLYDISIRKAKIINGFLKLVQESAMDCAFHRKENISSNPELAKLQCLETDSLDSEGKFIQVPGKLIEPILGRRRTTSRIPRSLGLFQINNEAGIFDIAGIIDTESKIVYNLYTYYGLDPELAGSFAVPQRQLIPIGTVTIQGTSLSGDFFQDFAGVTNQDELQRYDRVESARRKITLESGLPKPGIEEDQWLRAVRREYLISQQQRAPGDVADPPTSEPKTDISSYLQVLNITEWPIPPKKLLESFKTAKTEPSNSDKIPQIKDAYGKLRKLLRKS